MLEDIPLVVVVVVLVLAVVLVAVAVAKDNLVRLQVVVMEFLVKETTEAVVKVLSPTSRLAAAEEAKTA
jgi:hypothetical protein